MLWFPLQIRAKRQHFFLDAMCTLSRKAVYQKLRKIYSENFLRNRAAVCLAVRCFSPRCARFFQGLESAGGISSKPWKKSACPFPICGKPLVPASVSACGRGGVSPAGMTCGACPAPALRRRPACEASRWDARDCRTIVLVGVLEPPAVVGVPLQEPGPRRAKSVLRAKCARRFAPRGVCCLLCCVGFSDWVRGAGKPRPRRKLCGSCR